MPIEYNDYFRDISIHALLTESDVLNWHSLIHQSDFNPRSPHGERQHSFLAVTGATLISIHALLTESDSDQGFHLLIPGPISIHALLTESDMLDRLVQV